MLQTGRTGCGFGRVGTERSFSTERNKGASETVPQQANALCRQTRGSRARVSHCGNCVATPHGATVVLRVRGRVRTPGSRSFLLLLRWLRRVAADLDVRNTRIQASGCPAATDHDWTNAPPRIGTRAFRPRGTCRARRRRAPNGRAPAARPPRRGVTALTDRRNLRYVERSPTLSCSATRRRSCDARSIDPERSVVFSGERITGCEARRFLSQANA